MTAKRAVGNERNPQPALLINGSYDFVRCMLNPLDCASAMADEATPYWLTALPSRMFRDVVLSFPKVILNT
jgi:hypothetical protein